MLRDYQQRAISDLRARYRDRPVLCLPTGAGKTSVAAEIIRTTTAKGNRAVFLVHRRELVDQAVERLGQFGVEAGRILAGHREERELPAQVASIPTLSRREHWPAQLVIVDECAHTVSKSWLKVMDRYADSWVIGLTATPMRLDGKGLGDVFGCIVEPVRTSELVERGYLVAPRVFAPPVDLSGLPKRAGDYSIPELAVRMSKLTGNITETWHQRAENTRTVAFAVNIEHSQSIVAAFGSIAAHIDGTTPYAQRAATLASLGAGSIRIVSNVGVLTEGWDLPELGCVILARPTKSLALYRQMVGRVMRPPGPVLVLDHAGNTIEHGLVTDNIQWTLEGRAKKPGEQPTRQCPECFAVFAANLTECPECGALLETKHDEPAVDNPGELVELFAATRTPTLEERAQEYMRLVRVANDRNYKLGWAKIRYQERFGLSARFPEVDREHYICSGHEWETKQYGWKSVLRCARCLIQSSHG